MARRKRAEADLAAWSKAHEAEAKRAERNAKAFSGDVIGEAWLTYAGRCRREAVAVLTRDLFDDVEPVTVEAVTAPASGNAWRDHLLALEAADAARFAAARS